MRKIRQRLNSMLYRKGVWVDLEGRYDPTIRGSTYTTRLVRLKRPAKGYGLSGVRLAPQLFKRRCLPADYIEIAKKHGFEPVLRHGYLWDVFDREVGDRQHDLHRSKSRAWLSCYRAAIERSKEPA